MGHARIRRPPALRVPGPRGGAGRALLVHDSQQARELPPSLRPLRSGPKVARFDAHTRAKLLRDPGIVRNRAKVASAVQNARLFLEVRREFGSFSNYVWAFVGGAPIVHRRRSPREVPAPDARIESPLGRSSRPRLPLRRADDLLRLHAGRRDGQRSPGELLPVPRAGESREMKVLAAQPPRTVGATLRATRPFTRATVRFFLAAALRNRCKNSHCLCLTRPGHPPGFDGPAGQPAVPGSHRQLPQCEPRRRAGSRRRIDERAWHAVSCAREKLRPSDKRGSTFLVPTRPERASEGGGRRRGDFGVI